MVRPDIRHTLSCMAFALAIGAPTFLPLTASAQVSAESPLVKARTEPGEAPAKADPAADEAQDARPAEASPAAAEPTQPTEPAASSDSKEQEDAASSAASSKTETQPSPPSRPRLRISSWSGAYGAAQSKTIVEPLRKELDLEIERVARKGNLGSLSSFDAVELNQTALRTACANGQIRKLDAQLVGPIDALPADVSGTCAAPTFAWSSLVVMNPAAIGTPRGRKARRARKRRPSPTTLRDVFDVTTFPGKRAFIRTPERLLEMALLADGVVPQELYATLTEREGRDRAFRKLAAIASNIVWVKSQADAWKALDDGSAAFAMVYSGQAFRRLIAGELKPIWQGHIIDYAGWAIPKGASAPEQAQRFIRAATSPETLAAQARIWPYGPMRQAALSLAREHAILGIDLTPYQPTSDLRRPTGIVFDAAFWNRNRAALTDRFTAWLDEGLPLGIRVPAPIKAPPPPAASPEAGTSDSGG